MSQFLDSAFQTEATSQLGQARKLQSIPAHKRNGSPFSQRGEHSPLQRIEQAPMRPFGSRRTTTEPSSAPIDYQLKREVQLKLQQEQRALEGKLAGLCDIPLLDEFCSARSRGTEGVKTQLKSFTPSLQ